MEYKLHNATSDNGSVALIDKLHMAYVYVGVNKVPEKVLDKCQM